MLHYRIQRQGLPIGIGVKPQIFLLRFSSPVPATSQPIAALLRPSQFSQFFSQLFSTAQVFFISSHLSSTLFTSSPLFSTLPTSSHLPSTHLTSFSALVNSSHLLSTLLISFHGDALNSETLTHRSFCTEKLLQREAFAQSKLLHREAFTHP